MHNLILWEVYIIHNVQCLIVQNKELKVNDFFHEIHVKGKILSMLKIMSTVKFSG